MPGKDRILGVTIVGEHAGDLLAEFVLAMKHGLGLNKILGTIHTYPTLAEANKYAAGDWKRAHAPQRLLRVGRALSRLASAAESDASIATSHATGRQLACQRRALAARLPGSAPRLGGQRRRRRASTTATRPGTRC